MFVAVNGGNHDKNNGNGGLSTEALIGIICGSVGALLILTIVIIVVVKKKKSKSRYTSV